jgi:hypothetical protein
MEELEASIESTCQWCDANGLAAANRLALTTTIGLRDRGRFRGSLAGPLHAKFKSTVVFLLVLPPEFSQTKLWNALCSLDVAICDLAE